MGRKRGLKKYLKNNLLSLSIFIILMISGIVMAGDIIVNEGNLEIGNNLNVSNVLFVNSTKVGIGTASPLHQLHLSTGGNAEFMLNGANAQRIILNGTTPRFEMGNNYHVANAFTIRDATASADRFVIDKSGNATIGTLFVNAVNGRVGIGTATPVNKLDIAGATYANPATSGSAADGSLRVGSSGHGEVIDFGISGSPWIQARLSSNYATNYNLLLNPNGGSVGIGATSPTSGIELDVEGQAECDGAGCWTVESDLSYKENVVNLSKYGLTEIMKIQPREYDYKETGNHSFGFIAQELKLIVPEIVYGIEGNMSIGYGGLTPVLVKAIQEQQIQIEQMKLTLCLDGHTEYC